MAQAKRKRISRVWLVVAIIIAFLLIAALTFFLFRWGQPATQSDDQSTAALTEEVQNSKMESSADTQAFLEKYEDQYQEIRNTVAYSDPTSWKKEEVDKAYFLLAYTQQSKGYRFILILLDELETAKAGGVDIDDNTLGRDEAYRTSLRAEAEAALEAIDGSADEPSTATGGAS